jgi:hypothetical protein
MQVPLSISSSDAVGGSQWEVQALSAKICAGAHRWCSVLKMVSPLGRDDYSYDVELYASAKMLRFRKNIRFRLNSEISF